MISIQFKFSLTVILGALGVSSVLGMSGLVYIYFFRETVELSWLFLILETFPFMNILVCLFLLWKVVLPLKELEKSARKIGKGELGYQIKTPVDNELGDVIEAFNKMSRKLRENREIEIQLQKLKVIDQMFTTISHEINNPLMIIGGHSEFVTKRLDQEHKRKIEKLDRVFSDIQTLRLLVGSEPTEDMLERAHESLMNLSRDVGWIHDLEYKRKEYIEDKLNKVGLEVQRIYQVIQKMRDIKKPVESSYIDSSETMIDLDESGKV